MSTPKMSAPALARGAGANVIVKKGKQWKNTIPESRSLGVMASKGELIAMIDADCLIPRDYFAKLLPVLQDARVAVVGGMVLTGGRSLLNRMLGHWDRTYRLRLADEPRGVAVFKKRIFREVGGYRDVQAEDTDLYLRMRQRGYEVRIVEDVVVRQIRLQSLRRILRRQQIAGNERARLQQHPLKVFAHAVVRGRPLVLFSFLLAHRRRRTHERKSEAFSHLSL